MTDAETRRARLREYVDGIIADIHLPELDAHIANIEAMFAQPVEQAQAQTLDAENADLRARLSAAELGYKPSGVASSKFRWR